MMNSIEEKISYYLDGDLTEEQEAELHHLMSVSPEARTLFREHMRLQGVARDERVLLAAEPALQSGLFSRLADEGMDPTAAPVGVAVSFSGGPSDAAMTSAILAGKQGGPSMPSSIDPARPAIAADAVDPARAEKRRRRLVPFLIPFLIAGITGGLLWFNDGLPFGGGSDTGVIEGEVFAGNDQLGTDAADPIIEEATPLTGADEESGVPNAVIGQTDRDLDTEVIAPMRNRNAGETAPSRPIIEESISAEERRSRPAATSTRGGGAVPPTPVATTSSLGSTVTPDASLAFAEPRIDDERLAPRTRSAAAVSRDASSTPSPLAVIEPEVVLEEVVGREHADMIADNSDLYVHDDHTAATSFSRDADAHLTVASPPSESPSGVIKIVDEDGNPVTATRDNQAFIREILRGEGIDIRDDGTFSFQAPASNGPIPVALSPGNLLRAGGGWAAAAIGEDDVEGGYIADEEVAYRKSAASPKAEAAAIPSDNAEARREDGHNAALLPRVATENNYFVSLTGNLAAPVDATVNPMPIGGIADQPTTGSELLADMIVKGGILLGKEKKNRLFGLAGVASYGKQRARTNNLSAAPLVPVGYSRTTAVEVWVGAGYRQSLELSESVATGLEVIAGVGDTRFHAGIAAPLTIEATEKMAIEIGPTLRYRRAHRSLEQTSSAGDADIYEGPAEKEELQLGGGIELILLID